MIFHFGIVQVNFFKLNFIELFPYIKYVQNNFGGRVDDLSFFEYLSPFCFLSTEFHCTFSISYKILPYFLYYDSIFIRLSGLLSLVPALLFSILTPLFLSSSSVPLSYSSLAVPIHECLGKHSCMAYPFPIAILNGTSSFLCLVQENINMPSGHYYRHCSWSGH